MSAKQARSTSFNFNSLKDLTLGYDEVIKKCVVFQASTTGLKDEYILNTIDHYLLKKGLPCIAISELNPEKTNYYISKLPQVIRKKIYNLGIYYLYKKLSTNIREVMNDLYLDVDKHHYMVVLLTSLRELLSELINYFIVELKAIVIIDRGPLSTYLYHKTITREESFSDCDYLIRAKPGLHFFVENQPDSKNPEKIQSMDLNYGTYNFFNVGFIKALKKLSLKAELKDYDSSLHKLKPNLENPSSVSKENLLEILSLIDRFRAKTD